MGKKERSPGPAAYTIASTVTKNAPAFSFGTMKRPAPSGGPSMSPGPIYQLKASVGRYKDNTFRSNPSFGFGTSERPDPGGMSKFNRVPGPGEYLLGSTVGPHKPPTYKSASKFGFGTGARMPGGPPVPKRLDRTTLEKLAVAPGGAFAGGEAAGAVSAPTNDNELTQTPGPGTYDGGAWRKKNAPAFSFGTGAQRPAAATRANRVPGPGHYKLGSSTGKNTAVTMRKGPSISFGTGKIGGGPRPPDVPVHDPWAGGTGPGSYPIPSGFGTQHDRHRTLPQFSFGCTPRETGVYD